MEIKKNTRFQLYAQVYGRYARAPSIAESIRCDKDCYGIRKMCWGGVNTPPPFSFRKETRGTIFW